MISLGMTLTIASLSLNSVVIEASSSCSHEHTPQLSYCSGCPPRDPTGKLCASTTRYNDLTKGACGCGTEPNSPSYWTKTKYTAALNCKNLDPANPELGWCPSQCGTCFKLCNTGGTTTGKPGGAGKCIVVQVENRCGDGYNHPNEAQWCRQQMSYQECANNPKGCATQGNTNDFGYSAHFDLQDYNYQITKLGWDNPEVTFEPVSCSTGDFGDWNSSCYCPSAKGYTNSSAPF